MRKVYISGYKKSTLIQKKVVKLRDIAEINAPQDIQRKVEDAVIIQLENKKIMHVISIIDIIKVLDKQFKDVVIYNVGEKDMIVQHLTEPPKRNILKECLKMFVACSIIFAGATIAIMAYQTDVALPRTFVILNKVFTEQVDTNPLWITIPYSIGLPIGVLVFFNHIGTKKITDDPTPIEVEINNYETNVEDTQIDIMNQHKRGNEQ